MTASVFAVVFPGGASSQVAKPSLHVAKDGFPAGHDTPEGVASDIARASEM